MSEALCWAHQVHLYAMETLNKDFKILNKEVAVTDKWSTRLGDQFRGRMQKFL